MEIFNLCTVYRMSAYGTKKAGGDIALQLTFPEVAAAAIALSGPTNPYGYVGRLKAGTAHMEPANDFQQEYHAEKTRDAHRISRDRVHNEARSRWLLNHNTFGYTQPKPVLVQRIFANPSGGCITDIYSARRTMSPGPIQPPITCTANGLQGGIVRTKEGQQYVHKLRMARIEQLNAIENGEPSISDAPLTPAKPYSEDVDTEETPEMSDKAKIDLKSLLSQIQSELAETKDLGLYPAMTLTKLNEKVTSMARLLFRLAISFTRYDFNDALNFLQRCYQLIRIQPNRYEEVNELEPVRANNQRRLEEFFRALVIYTEEMFTFVNRPINEKKLKSQNLIRTLGFTQLSGEPVSHGLITEQQKAGRMGVEEWYELEKAHRNDEPPYAGITLAQLRKICEGLEIPTKTKNGGPIRKSTLISILKLKYPPPLTSAAPERGITQSGGEPKEQSPQPSSEPAEGKEVNFNRGAVQGQGKKRVFRGRPSKVKTLPPVPEENTPHKLKPSAFNSKTKFDVDRRIRFGDSQGAYLGENFGDSVPLQPVPVPVLPDGALVRPGSGYTRPTFPRFRQAKEKPNNDMSVKAFTREPQPAVFQNSKAPPQLGIFAAKRIGIPKAVLPQPRKVFSYTGGKSILGLTRKNLPTTREGYVELADKLKGSGHTIRVNSGSSMKNIRANFIRRLGL
jgi:hypothetical protein